MSVPHDSPCHTHTRPSLSSNARSTRFGVLTLLLACVCALVLMSRRKLRNPPRTAPPAPPRGIQHAPGSPCRYGQPAQLRLPRVGRTVQHRLRGKPHPHATSRLPPPTFKHGQHRLAVAAHLHALTELLLDPAPFARTRTVLAPVLTDRTRRRTNHDTPLWHAQLSARPHGRSPIAFVPLLHAAQHTRERSAGAVSGANTPPFKLTTTPPYERPSPPRRQDVTARHASPRDPTPP